MTMSFSIFQMDEEAKLRAISTAAMEEVRRSYNQDSDATLDSTLDVSKDSLEKDCGKGNLK